MTAAGRIGRFIQRLTPIANAGTRWGVVATVREPVSLVAAFAAYHLAAGASSVRLYFDDPDDPAADLLAPFDGIEVVRCDAAHWRRTRLTGRRPDLVTYRQISNVQHAYRTSGLDWIAHLDADEFLWLPNGLAPCLAARSRRAAWIRLPVAERVWSGAVDRAHLFTGSFRTTLPGRFAEVDEVYGPKHRFLYPEGTAGHFMGKPLIDMARFCWPRIHEVRSTPVPWRILPHDTLSEGALLHFEGMTARRWALKQMRLALLILDGGKPNRDVRRKVTEQILRAPDPLKAALKWFRRTYVLPDETVARLEAHGAFLRPELDIAGAVAKHLPGLAVDFSVDTLDALGEDALQSSLAEVLRRRDAN